jgi:hypothetical protein
MNTEPPADRDAVIRAMRAYSLRMVVVSAIAVATVLYSLTTPPVLALGLSTGASIGWLANVLLTRPPQYPRQRRSTD